MAKLFWLHCFTALAGKLGKNKHSTFPSERHWQLLLALTGSLYEEVLPLLQYSV